MNNNKSREYLASMSIPDREELAQTLGVNPLYIYQIGAGIRSPGRSLAIRMEMLLNGKVKELDFDNEIKADLLRK